MPAKAPPENIAGSASGSNQPGASQSFRIVPPPHKMPPTTPSAGRGSAAVVPAWARQAQSNLQRQAAQRIHPQEQEAAHRVYEGLPAAPAEGDVLGVEAFHRAG